jgi:hypothetical protein
MTVMKKIYIILMAAAFAAVSCVNPDAEVDFGVDLGVEDGVLAVGPEGGIKKINVTSSGEWVVMTENPWITVSPANGRGSAECVVSIDSTLAFDQRQGAVRIQSLSDADEKQDFTISQAGFPYQITLDKQNVEVEDFAELDSRSFDVVVKSNVDFTVDIPDDAKGWLSYKTFPVTLDRGARPRSSKIHFEWKVNSRDHQRIADVKFMPKEEVTLGKHDDLKVVQKAALPIPVGTPAGDSLAVLAVSRALGMFTEWETSEKMEHWTNIRLWKDGPNKGRIRYVQFFMFKTQESLPFEVQYLTAAEEIVFYSNANHFLRSLDTGEYITKLTQLKRLTIGAYGLTSLHPDFVNLKNLEYLDLGSNCFEELPDILTPENFPNLHALVLSANQRHTIYDLSNDTREKIGGFIQDDLRTEKGMNTFKRILKWNQLDTIRLSVNYLQGQLPDMMDEGLPEWTFEELKDSLATGVTEMPEKLVGLPKVLPNTSFFAINFNRFTGVLPDWLLYHPRLDQWVPYSLIFSQEGKSKDGKNAGFVNEPVSLDYYYDIYKNKKYNPNN